MGIGPTPKQLEAIKKMVSRKTIWWYLMKLPNGRWGALWCAGLESEHGSGLVENDYSGLAYMGTRKDTVNYIINDLKQMAEDDPVNCSFEETYIKDLAWHRPTANSQ